MNAAASKTAAVTPARKAIRWALTLAAGAIATGIVLVSVGIEPADLVGAYTPHIPAWGLLAQQPLILQFHIAAAVVALLVGLVIMVRPKGVGLHKTLGWTWVIAMASTAISSVFLIFLPDGGVSLIHLLSGFTLVILPMGVYAIRRGDVNLHRRRMTGLFMGGLLIAGLLTLLPGRLMWRVFFS